MVGCVRFQIPGDDTQKPGPGAYASEKVIIKFINKNLYHQSLLSLLLLFFLFFFISFHLHSFINLYLFIYQ